VFQKKNKTTEMSIKYTDSNKQGISKEVISLLVSLTLYYKIKMILNEDLY